MHVFCYIPSNSLSLYSPCEADRGFANELAGGEGGGGGANSFEKWSSFIILFHDISFS